MVKTEKKKALADNINVTALVGSVRTEVFPTQLLCEDAAVCRPLFTTLDAFTLIALASPQINDSCVDFWAKTRGAIGSFLARGAICEVCIVKYIIQEA